MAPRGLVVIFTNSIAPVKSLAIDIVWYIGFGLRGMRDTRCGLKPTLRARERTCDVSIILLKYRGIASTLQPCHPEVSAALTLEGPEWWA